MKIKVIKSTDSRFWYAKHIGQEFEIEWEELTSYWVREPSGFLNFVLVEDSAVVIKGDVRKFLKEHK